ncbi:MAG: urease accessory UreF family protein [Pseudomonadota bacterium]
MTTPALLTLVQWLSPAFPTGGYAYSHGLEQVITDGAVSDGDSLRRWLADVLKFGAGRQDAVLLALSLRGGADHDALSALARALQPSAERLSETVEQGAAFARAVSALTGRDLPARPLPVAVGQAASTLDLPPAQVLALYLHAFASNLVSAAVRFVPLGQDAGQAVLSALHPVVDGLARDLVDATPDDLQSAALGADLAAMRHETLDVRIFKT